MKIYLREVLLLSVGLAIWAAVSLSLQAVSIHVMKIENNTYMAYAESSVKDGDLNIINNIEPSMSWLASETYNYPDMREWASAIVWVPFSLYAKLLENSGFVTHKEISHYDYAQTLGTIFCTLLFFILASGLAKNLNFTSNTKFVLNSFFWGTAFCWYAIFETSGSDLVSNFFLLLSFYLFFLAVKNQEGLLRWSLLGLVFGLAAVVKVHTVFYALAPVIFLFVSRKEDQVAWKKFFSYVGGFLVIFIFNAVNLYLKWGFYGNPYLAISNFIRSEFGFTFGLFKFLFGPNGYFLVSPIYILSFFGIILHFLTPKKSSLDKLIFSIFCAFFITLVSTSFRPGAEELLASRQFLGQQFVLILGAFVLLEKFKNSKFLKSLFVLATAWNLLMVAWYFTDKDLEMSSYPRIDGHFFARIAEAWSREFSKAMPIFLSVAGWVILWIPIFLLSYFFIKKYRSSEKLIYGLITGFILIFLTVSLINFANNKRNAEALKSEGFFQNKVIGNGMNIYIYDDVISSLDHYKNVAIANQDLLGLEKVVHSQSVFYQMVQSQILIDPIGFGILKPNEKHKPSFWDAHDLARRQRFIH